MHFFVQKYTYKEVFKAIMSLKNKFSSRWDDIPSFVIKKAAHTITIPLMFFNNLSLNNGEFPKKLKYLVFRLLFQKGADYEYTHYCPVAFLPRFSKILEGILAIFLLIYC